MENFVNKLFRRKKDDRNTKTVIIPEPNPARLNAEAEQAAAAHALRVFDQYNANKAAFLYEMLPQKKKAIFDLVPLFIHFSGAEILRCTDACELSPHGVYGYEPREETLRSFSEAFPGEKPPRLQRRAGFDPNLPIKSICLIGSLGSIAQGPKSDFDYWICYEGRVFSRESFMYFREKLREIEQWAMDFAGAEVHFFPLDIQDVRRDNFGPATGESSGSAQGKLLKEEFYRTMTLVAGQVPLWWVMPPGVNDGEYLRLAEIIGGSGRVDYSRLVDMGNIRSISLGEFYGAAIWQINKTMGSPFKSILKMAMLEEYMLNHGRRGLLCTELKTRLLANEAEAIHLDPYVLLFDRAGTYLAEQNRLEDLDLLRRSLYMKSGANLTLADYRKKELPRKKRVMVNLVREWGWNHQRIDQLNNFQNWTFRESQEFSQETHDFIIRTYKTISSELSKQSEQVGLIISQRDLTVLGRKLFVYYSKRTNKVESTLNVIEAPPALNGLTLQPLLDSQGERVWRAFRVLLSWSAVQADENTRSALFSSPDLAQILIWLVNNQLYDSRTSINLNLGDGRLGSPCTLPELQKLLKEMKAFFPPDAYKDVPEDELLKKPRTVKMMAVINLEEPDNCRKIVQTGICLQNNWGEIFYKGYGDHSQEGLLVARNFVRKYFSFDPLGALDNFKAFLPERQFRKILGPSLDKFFGFKVVR
ncbi:MAG: class I adenylate cyclase [Pseudomonadota bacterium]